MRGITLLGVVVAAACGARGPAAALPEPPPVSLSDTAPMLVPGEQTTWNVFWRGVTVGRADLTIGQSDARSSFKTSTLASALASVRYDLSTTFARGRVVGLHEVLRAGGDTTDVTADVDGGRFTTTTASASHVPGGTQLHTLHSALGVIRAWSLGEARAGYLWLLHQGKLFRLDVFKPSRDEALGLRALRVDGVVRALDSTPPINVTLWLAANRERIPLRFVIDDVSAEASESTAAFEAR